MQAEVVEVLVVLVVLVVVVMVMGVLACLLLLTQAVEVEVLDHMSKLELELVEVEL
jgi:hypothetical protein